MKRMNYPPSYTAHFEHAKETTIWKTLYGYRSCVAHGDKPDFAKSMQILKDQENVVIFLNKIIKALLLYSMDEPILMLDLKQC